MANKFGMFLIGGVVGAVAALLAAPRSGAETRAMVADKAGEFAGNAQQWGDSAAAGAQHIYQEAATKGAEVGIGTGGKIDAAGKGLGVCADVEVVGRYTYYVIKIGKTEGVSATVGG